MSVRIQDTGQSDLSSLASTRSSATNGAGASNVNSSQVEAQAGDTATISGATAQLSGDVPFRQDRVDALRAQMESGTYTVNAHAVATAMFQNLFRS
jgi:flagellar biosynthesis anti-sigma factor FlgM